MQIVFAAILSIGLLLVINLSGGSRAASRWMPSAPACKPQSACRSAADRAAQRARLRRIRRQSRAVGAQRRQDGARGRGAGHPDSGPRAGDHANRDTACRARPRRRRRRQRAVLAPVVAALLRRRSAVLASHLMPFTSDRRPIAILVGDPAWQVEAAHLLDEAGLSVWRVTDQAGYIDRLVEAHAALVLVDGDAQDWRWWVAAAKVRQETRRIPVFVIATGAARAAEALSAGADRFLTADSLVSDLPPRSSRRRAGAGRVAAGPAGLPVRRADAAARPARDRALQRRGLLRPA